MSNSYAGGNPTEWAREQMSALKYEERMMTRVAQLLEVWWTQYHDNQSRDLTLETFGKLARGQALVVQSDVNEAWEPVKPGDIYVRNEIRVRFDAYTDEPTGRAHNGRRGVVVAIRNGDIIVNYTDGRMPEGQGVHHSPHSLERLVR
jgi:hypothetical protein